MSVIATMKDGTKVITDVFVSQMRGVCKGGEVNLSRFPNLCYAPDKGVHGHMTGVSVEAIAQMATSHHYESGNLSMVALLDELANSIAVDFDELLDALRYARDNDMI